MESENKQQLETPSHSEILSLLRKLKYVVFVVVANFLFVLFVFKAIAVLGKPLFLFDLFTKCYIAEDSCPNDNVTFWLYTRYSKKRNFFKSHKEYNHNVKSS